MYLKLLKEKKFNIYDTKKKEVLDDFSAKLNFNLQKKNLKKKKNFIFYIYITTSVRGFYVNILNFQGKVLKQFTSGKSGYKKALRYNLVSLRTLLNEVRFFFINFNLKDTRSLRLYIILKGFNTRRNGFVRGLVRALFQFRRSIVSIIDLTDLPYNGCRSKKLRRK
jgi:ribosomal protein S11